MAIKYLQTKKHLLKIGLKKLKDAFAAKNLDDISKLPRLS